MRPDLRPADQPFERVAGRHCHQWHVVGRLPPELELVSDCRAHCLNGPALLRCDVAVDVDRHRPRRQKRERRRHCNRQRDHGPCGHDHAARCQQLLCLHSCNRLRHSWLRNDGFAGTDPGKRQDAIPMGASHSNSRFAPESRHREDPSKCLLSTNSGHSAVKKNDRLAAASLKFNWCFDQAAARAFRFLRQPSRSATVNRKIASLSKKLLRGGPNLAFA